MSVLTRGDAERMLRFVAEAESFGGDHAFAGEFLTRVARLLPADWIGYSECECGESGREGSRYDFWDGNVVFSGVDWPAVTPVLDAENPVALHFRQGSFDAVKISDFFTQRELHRTRMYHLVLKPCGVEDSLGVQLPIPPRRRPK